MDFLQNGMKVVSAVPKEDSVQPGSVLAMYVFLFAFLKISNFLQSQISST